METQNPPQIQGFQGLTVLSFESRFSEVMSTHIKRLGGNPLSAPSMQEIPLDKNPEALVFGEKLLQNEIDMVIFMTGVGAKYLISSLAERYSLEKMIPALQRCTVVARGPKPVKVLKAFGIPVTIAVPEPNTWREIIEVLDQSERGIALDRASVAIQEYGEENPRLIEALKKRGARIIQIPVYRWALPDDLEPLKAAIRQTIEGKVDFALITSAIQIKNVLKVAAQMGVEKEFKKAFAKTVIASIGPTSSEAILEKGFSVDLEPSHSKMGILVSETAQKSAALLKRKRESRPTFQSLQSFQNNLKNARDLRRQSPFIKACFKEKTDYTPVWLMRQAGRYMKEYQEIRSKVGFMQLCKQKELAAEVTLLAANQLKTDAAIIFSDILLLLEPMGLSVEYTQSDGPQIADEISCAQDVMKIPEIEPCQSLAYVLEAIKLTRSHLNPRIPLIGFSGAPFTLASYALESGASKNFLKTKQFMYTEPRSWHLLLEKISRALVKFLNAQVDAGADALQLFDSWVGCLNAEDYRRYVLPHSQYVLSHLPSIVPVIHFGTGTASILKEMSLAGGQVLGLDFRISLKRAWKEIDYQQAVQGNLDPAVLFAEPAVIREKVQSILNEAEGRPGHIFNLGHGILPNTPVEQVIRLVEWVKDLSRRTPRASVS